MQLARLNHQKTSQAITLLTPNGKECAAASFVRLLSRKSSIPTDVVCHECGVVNPSDVAARANVQLAEMGIFIGSTRPPGSKQWVWDLYSIPAANDATYSLIEGE